MIYIIGLEEHTPYFSKRDLFSNNFKKTKVWFGFTILFWEKKHPLFILTNFKRGFSIWVLFDVCYAIVKPNTDFILPLFLIGLFRYKINFTKQTWLDFFEKIWKWCKTLRNLVYFDTLLKLNFIGIINS